MKKIFIILLAASSLVAAHDGQVAVVSAVLRSIATAANDARVQEEASPLEGSDTSSGHGFRFFASSSSDSEGSASSEASSEASLDNDLDKTFSQSLYSYWAQLEELASQTAAIGRQEQYIEGLRRQLPEDVLNVDEDFIGDVVPYSYYRSGEEDSWHADPRVQELKDAEERLISLHTELNKQLIECTEAAQGLLALCDAYKDKNQEAFISLELLALEALINEQCKMLRGLEFALHPGAPFEKLGIQQVSRMSRLISALKVFVQHSSAEDAGKMVVPEGKHLDLADPVWQLVCEFHLDLGAILYRLAKDWQECEPVTAEAVEYNPALFENEFVDEIDQQWMNACRQQLLGYRSGLVKELCPHTLSKAGRSAVGERITAYEAAKAFLNERFKLVLRGNDAFEEQFDLPAAHQVSTYTTNFMRRVLSPAVKRVCKNLQHKAHSYLPSRTELEEADKANHALTRWFSYFRPQTYLERLGNEASRLFQKKKVELKRDVVMSVEVWFKEKQKMAKNWRDKAPEALATFNQLQQYRKQRAHGFLRALWEAGLVVMHTVTPGSVHLDANVSQIDHMRDCLRRSRYGLNAAEYLASLDIQAPVETSSAEQSYSRKITHTIYMLQALTRYHAGEIKSGVLQRLSQLRSSSEGEDFLWALSRGQHRATEAPREGLCAQMWNHLKSAGSSTREVLRAVATNRLLDSVDDADNMIGRRRIRSAANSAL